jgi:hypothetical protein
MSKFLVSLLFVLSALGWASAQGSRDVHATFVELSGTMRKKDGTVRHFSGIKVPMVGHRVDVLPAGSKAEPSAPNGNMGRDMIVYDARTGPYWILQDPDPSSLDDSTLQGGAGQYWSRFQFGFHLEVSRPFMIRWIVFDKFVENLGPGVSAFEDVLLDLRVNVTDPPEPGGWAFTLNMKSLFFEVPDDTVFIAQQFREPHPQGEGAFDLAFRTIYAVGAAPMPGSSENLFFYDEDLNGIYDEEEAVWFGAENHANHYRMIEVGGILESIVPNFVDIVQGAHAGGTLADLGASDDVYYVLRNLVQLQQIIAIFEGTASTHEVDGLKITFEGKSTALGTVKIEAWDFTSNEWVDGGTHNLSATDEEIELFASGAAAFVNPIDKKLRLRITANPPPMRSIRTWLIFLDQLKWTTIR